MLKRKALPLAISLIVCSAHTGAVTIENPGFEDGMDSWTEKDPASISSVEYSGSKSLKINGSPGRVHQVVDVEPYTDYTLYAYVDGAGQIGVNDGTTTLFKNYHFDVDSWTKVSVSFNSGSFSSIQIFAKYTSGTDDVRFDDFSLVANGTTPTPSTPTPTPSGDCNVSELEILSATDDGDNDGHGPGLAIDDSTSSDSRWSSEGEDKWIKFDLGGTTTLDNLKTAWYKGDSRTAYFDIETSEDGNSWSTAVSGAKSQGTTSLRSDDLGGVFARYVRVIGNGNSSNSWNSLLEAQIYGCDDITPTPTPVTPTPTPTPTPTTPTPTPSTGSAIPSNIIDGSLYDLEGEKPHPLVDSDTLEFVALEAKVTTPNGNGWRHEYKIKEDLRVAMTDTYEYFAAKIKVDLSDGGKVIVAQHHAGDTGTIMKLYVADSSESDIGESIPGNGIFGVYVRIRNTDGDEEKKALGTIQSGDSFSFEVVNNYGVVSVSAFGKELETEVEDDSASYLKFGNYLQSQYPDGNKDCGEHGDSDSFAECFDDIGITTSKITMTNVTYERIER